MYAAISPRDYEVGLIRHDDRSVHILDRDGVEVSSISAERYLSRYPDTMVVHIRDGRHAVEVLAERATMSICLDMTLSLFDRDVSIQTRQELARQLNRLFRTTGNRDYVLDIILCRPLPPVADVDGAVAAAASSRNTRRVVTSIVNCQERVRRTFESWLLVKQEPIVQRNDVERVYALLSRYGVFRRLALEASDTTDLAALEVALAKDASLNNQLDAAPRIVAELVNELCKKLPAGDGHHASNAKSSLKSEGKSKTKRRSRPRRATTRSAAGNGPTTVDVSALVKAKTLVDQVGGIEKAQALLAALKKLE